MPLTGKKNACLITGNLLDFFLLSLGLWYTGHIADFGTQNILPIIWLSISHTFCIYRQPHTSLVTLHLFLFSVLVVVVLWKA